MLNRSSTPLLTSLLLGTIVAAQGEITLDSLPTGTEGGNHITDTTPLVINESGDVMDPKDGSMYQDFEISGQAGGSQDIVDRKFSFILSGISKVDDQEGKKLGKLLKEGTLDRDSKGNLGIREGASGGIEALEGFMIGLDAKGLDESLAIHLTGLTLRFIGGDETGKVVKREDPNQSVTFGSPQSEADYTARNGSPFVDLSSLDLQVRGGESNPALASLFADNYTDGGEFRIESFQIKIVDAD